MKTSLAPPGGWTEESRLRVTTELMVVACQQLGKSPAAARAEVQGEVKKWLRGGMGPADLIQNIDGVPAVSIAGAFQLIANVYDANLADPAVQERYAAVVGRELDRLATEARP